MSIGVGADSGRSAGDLLGVSRPEHALELAGSTADELEQSRRPRCLGAPAGDEAAESVIRRCRLTPPRSTTAERAVDAAGWIPFWNVDQQLVREDVEIIGGMRGADGMCRPATYNLFVFVGGRFAGVLSPTPMTSRLDSSSGVVRLPLPAITAEFVRFSQHRSALLPVLAGDRPLSHRSHGRRAGRRAGGGQRHPPVIRRPMSTRRRSHRGLVTSVEHPGLNPSRRQGIGAMTDSRAYFDQLNRAYNAVHKAKEDLFWATYMAISDDQAGFARAENAYKDFISDPAKLQATRDHLARAAGPARQRGTRRAAARLERLAGAVRGQHHRQRRRPRADARDHRRRGGAVCQEAGAAAAPHQRARRVRGRLAQHAGHQSGHQSGGRAPPQLVRRASARSSAGCWTTASSIW